MKAVNVHVVQAFVDGTRGGNPAGVVLNADTMSDETKQQVAAAVGFSETAFVSRSEVADCRVDFYTPTTQVVDCGHATIAAFSYLKKIGRVEGRESTKEIATGVQHIYFRDDLVFMQQPVADLLPVAESGSRIDSRSILSAIGLKPVDLLQDLEPVIADNGGKGLIVPLQDEDSVVRIEPDHSAIGRICKVLDVLDYYVFSPETQMKGHDAGARMFGPGIGIAEEPATGMAAGQLACYLFEFLNMRKSKIAIEQGYLMYPPSPSVIQAELDHEDGRIQGVRVGGRAVVKGSFVVEIG